MKYTDGGGGGGFEGGSWCLCGVNDALVVNDVRC